MNKCKINHNTSSMRPLPRRSILHLIDSFSALSKRPPPRRWLFAALLGCCHVTGPSASSLDGPMGLCVVVGALCCPWALRVVVGAPWCRWALRVVIVLSMVLCIVDDPRVVNGPSILSIGLLLRRFAAVLSITRWVANGPVISSIGPPSC